MTLDYISSTLMNMTDEAAIKVDTVNHILDCINRIFTNAVIKTGILKIPKHYKKGNTNNLHKQQKQKPGSMRHAEK